MEERRCLGVETKPHLCVLFKPEASILCPTQTSVPSMFSVPGSHLESQLAHKKPPGTYSTPATLTAQWLALGSQSLKLIKKKMLQEIISFSCFGILCSALKLLKFEETHSHGFDET